jgi:hypothetical protein
MPKLKSTLYAKLSDSHIEEEFERHSNAIIELISHHELTNRVPREDSPKKVRISQDEFLDRMPPVLTMDKVQPRSSFDMTNPYQLTVGHRSVKNNSKLRSSKRSSIHNEDLILLTEEVKSRKSS